MTTTPDQPKQHVSLLKKWRQWMAPLAFVLATVALLGVIALMRSQYQYSQLWRQQNAQRVQLKQKMTENTALLQDLSTQLKHRRLLKWQNQVAVFVGLAQWYVNSGQGYSQAVAWLMAAKCVVNQQPVDTTQPLRVAIIKDLAKLSQQTSKPMVTALEPLAQVQSQLRQQAVAYASPGLAATAQSAAPSSILRTLPWYKQAWLWLKGSIHIQRVPPAPMATDQQTVAWVWLQLMHAQWAVVHGQLDSYHVALQASIDRLKKDQSAWVQHTKIVTQLQQMMRLPVWQTAFTLQATAAVQKQEASCLKS